MKRPLVFSTAYGISSVVLGPLIFAIAVGLTRGGGDYCDSSYRGLSEKVAEFHRAEVVLTVAPGLMIVLGAALLGWLWASIARQDCPRPRRPTVAGAVVTVFTLAAMCVYLLLVSHADLSAGQSC